MTPGGRRRTRAGRPGRAAGSAVVALLVLAGLMACSGTTRAGSPPSGASAGTASAGTASAGTAGAGSAGATTEPALALPRVPWEGGPQYWSRFSAASAAGWTDASFFPIGIWFDSISSNEEVAFDKAQGINTYIAGDVATPYRFFADNDVFWLGSRLQDTPAGVAANWVGVFLDDEVDGRFPPAEGHARLEALKKQVPAGRFSYANYTTLVVNSQFGAADSERYVNAYADVVSTDMYWYTIPFCGKVPYHSTFIRAVPQKGCRTASSYGRTMDMLRERDAADGKLQPLWQFVELLNGMGAEGPFIAFIEPAQLRGAVMSSLIHEARGIVYFNQSLVGSCVGGNIIRLAQVEKGGCGTPQVAAAAAVNAQVRQLAPVLNTQSYAYRFGSGLDTMLKVHDGHAYVFAMIDSWSSTPGRREFTLPEGVGGSTVEVLFENRSIPVRDRRFTDSFAAESSYHVYRIPLTDR